MIRLYNRERWRRLTADDAAVFRGGTRRVVVEVNSGDPVHLHLHSEDGDDEFFLAKIDGRNAIEFIAPDGEFAITSTGEVFISSVDGEAIHVTPIQESFARIAVRRPRNPELELMMAKVNANFTSLLEKQSREIERKIAQNNTRTSDRNIAREPTDAPDVTDVGPGADDTGGTEG